MAKNRVDWLAEYEKCIQDIEKVLLKTAEDFPKIERENVSSYKLGIISAIVERARDTIKRLI